jgi:hypothetical protein
VYDAAEIYLYTKISPKTPKTKKAQDQENRKSPKEKNLTIWLEKREKVIDSY